MIFNIRCLFLLFDKIRNMCRYNIDRLIEVFEVNSILFNGLVRRKGVV